MSQPISRTLVETYLRTRGIAALHETGSLRFHPRCYYRRDEHSPTETWPAMIASVTGLEGGITGAHRTWIATDGSDKAPIEPPRRAMGDLLGPAVRFRASGEVMSAGESIETILSLRVVIPEVAIQPSLPAAPLSPPLFPTPPRHP